MSDRAVMCGCAIGWGATLASGHVVVLLVVVVVRLLLLQVGPRERCAERYGVAKGAESWDRTGTFRSSV